jgi:alkanesulfonate monooxygenase SsuD/methylene tetrahydromethanopterin reductase-like flavin-dependent oxidoreductase (luciferase family)
LIELTLYPDQRGSWSSLHDRVSDAWADGWAGVWLCDHLLHPSGEDPGYFLECWTSLAALAATTPDLRLGSLVTAATFRHPALIAAMALVVSQVGRQRFTLGIGAGGDDEEHRRLGFPFPPMRRRLDDLEETCELLAELLTPGSVHHSGRRTVDIPDTGLVGKAPVDLLVGVTGRQGLTIAARYADAWAAWGSPTQAALGNAMLDAGCREVARDPACIRRAAIVMATAVPDDPRWPAALDVHPAAIRSALDGYRRAGIDELIVCDFALESPDREAQLRGLKAVVDEWNMLPDRETRHPGDA